MNEQAAVESKWSGLARPAGDSIQLNNQDFVALDRCRDTTYAATYRPQALYSRADAGFHANHGALLLHEVSTHLPIYRSDTGPTDFHLHLPPGGFQLVLVTSGAFTFDYDGRCCHVGPGTVMLQSAIVHRQLFYTWSGLPTPENLQAPQSVVPTSQSMGYSGRFLEAFITDPTTFPNPTIVRTDHIDEADTPRIAWAHELHDRPAGAGFWLQDPLALDALYRPLRAPAADLRISSSQPIFVRDTGIEAPSGQLVSGHIIATDPVGHALLPKSAVPVTDPLFLTRGEVVIYRVIRGCATFKNASGQRLELTAGDVVTANGRSLRLAGLEADTQVLRLGLLAGMERLRRWTPAQRDEIDGLGAGLITRRELRFLRTSGPPVGYLYR